MLVNRDYWWKIKHSRRSHGTLPLFSFLRISLFILSRVECGTVGGVQTFASIFVVKGTSALCHQFCRSISAIHSGWIDEMLFNFAKEREKLTQPGISLIAEMM